MSEADWYPADDALLRVYELRAERFDPRTEILNTTVGLQARRAYYVHLKRGSVVMPGSTVSLGALQASLWEDLGIPLERVRELESEIQVVRRGESRVRESE